MSGAALLACAAAVAAVAGLTDLAAAVAERPTARRPRRRPALLAALARVGRRLGAPAPPADLERRSEAAGVTR